MSKFYINVNSTKKFSSPEYQHEGFCILKGHKYYLPVYRVSWDLCTPAVLTCTEWFSKRTAIILIQLTKFGHDKYSLISSSSRKLS